MRLVVFLCLCASLLLGACRTGYVVTQTEGSMIPVDATWDSDTDAEALALLAPYKARVDSVMQRVVGVSAVSMDKDRPESPLSNLVADVLREAAAQVLGRPADMGLVNMGGLRNVLTKGEVTCGNIFEILPFENSLCVLTLKGTALKALFRNIAAKGGEGVSGVRMRITKKGELVDCSVNGREVEGDKLYTVATVDYLADGNDGMEALLQAEQRVCPAGVTLRKLFMEYFEKNMAAGKPVTARREGRITVLTSVTK